MDLKTHYTHLWEDTFRQYNSGHFELDPLLDDPQDKRFGITLLARPGMQVQEQMQYVIQQLREVEPEQYYYPASDLHITVLSIISCYTGFTLEQVQVEDYVSLLQEVLQPYSPFQIEFTGITASPSSVMVQGFPATEAMQALREELRVRFRNSSLQQSIDQRYTIRTAHSTIVRYRKPLIRPQEFISKLLHFRDYSFGTTQVQQLELVYNDWYQRKERVQVLERFGLG